MNPWEMKWGTQSSDKPWEQKWSGQSESQPSEAPQQSSAAPTNPAPSPTNQNIPLANLITGNQTPPVDNSSIPGQILHAIDNSTNYGLNTIYQAEQPFWHTLGKLVTGPAQLINNGMAKLTSYLPDNPVSRSFQQMANLTNDFVTRNEKEYQAANPPSLGKTLGTADAYALPFLFSAPSRLLAAPGEAIPSMVSKTGIPMTTLNAAKEIVPNLPARILNSAGQAATYGLVQPVTGDNYWKEKGKQVATNAAFGAALPVLGAGLSSLWGLGKGIKAGVIDPLANPDKIVSDTLLRAVGQKGANDILTSNPLTAVTPGVKYSAAQSTGNQGLAALEDVYKAQNAAGPLNQQAAQNRQALADSIRGLAKDEAAKTAAETARNNAVEDLYNQAKAGTYPASPELNSILNTPAGQTAKRMADQKFANIRTMGKTQAIPSSQGAIVDSSGNPFMINPEVPAEYQGKYLHEIKLNLDKLARLNPQNAADASALSGVDDVRSAYNSWLEDNIPQYGQAKSTYAQLSKPINQMDIGTVLKNKLLPATSGDIPTSLNAASYARSLQDPNALAAYATGYPRANFGQIMGPENASLVNGINQDASRMAEINRLGAGFGSPTARREAANDFLGSYFANRAPGMNKLLDMISNTPGLRAVSGATGKFGNMLKSQINANMATKLEDMLATNDPEQLRALLQDALSRNSVGKPTLGQLLSQPHYGPIKAAARGLFSQHPFLKNFMQQ